MSEDNRLRSEAARAMGSAKTPAKAESSRENVKAAQKSRWADPAARERHAAALREAHRRRKEQAEQKSAE